MRTLTAIALIVLSTGCTPVTVTSATSISPVLLGPVRAIGGPVETDLVTGFHSEARFSAGSSTSSSFAESSAASQLDWDVLIATNGRPERWVTLEEIDCGGYLFYVLLGGFNEVWCTARGLVAEPAAAPIAAGR